MAQTPLPSHAADAHAHPEESMMKKVWIPLLILVAITVVEFIIALALPWPKPIKSGLYIVLTLAKAFYIVAYFMHLKFEKLTLIYCILVPVFFILALIAALSYEASNLQKY
jgi:cytochrome c oxidase subunit IV